MAKLDLDRLAQLLTISEGLAKQGRFNHLQGMINEEIKTMNDEQDPKNRGRIVTPAAGPANSAVDLGDGRIEPLPQGGNRGQKLDSDDDSTGSGKQEGARAILNQQREQFEQSEAGKAIADRQERKADESRQGEPGDPARSPPVYPQGSGVKQTDTNPNRRDDFVNPAPTPTVPRRDI